MFNGHLTVSFCVCFCHVVRNPARNDGAPAAAPAQAEDRVDRDETGDANENVIIEPLS